MKASRRRREGEKGRREEERGKRRKYNPCIPTLWRGCTGEGGGGGRSQSGHLVTSSCLQKLVNKKIKRFL